VKAKAKRERQTDRQTERETERGKSFSERKKGFERQRRKGLREIEKERERMR
jgi:hypothetical protein